MNKKFTGLQKYELFRILLSIGIALVIVFAIIMLISKVPVEALTDFIIGPLKSTRRIGNIIEASIPIMFTGLSVIVLFRSGLFNLSMEGGFFIASVAAVASALIFDFHPIVNVIVATLVAMLVGGISTVIPGFLKEKADANELVTSLMLNYVLLFLGLYFITSFFYDPEMNATYSYKFDEGMQLMKIIPGTNVHLGLVVAIIAAILLWILLNKTPFGFNMTLIGQNREMAKYSGVNIVKVVIFSQFLGGLFAGLGASMQLFGMYSRFQYTGLTNYGWDGILVAIIAKKNPLYVPFAALFLGYLRTGASIMSRNTDMPYEIISIIQAIVIVLISSEIILSKYKKKVISKETLEAEGGTE